MKEALEYNEWLKNNVSSYTNNRRKTPADEKRSSQTGTDQTTKINRKTITK